VITILRPSTRVVIYGAEESVKVEQPGRAGNGLLNALIAYWPGNEANGNALDLHTNALHLTDTNTVTSAAGLVYATARQYTRANSERHVRPGDDALLSLGDLDATIATWLNMDSKPASDMCILGKDEGWTAATTEYNLEYNAFQDRLSVWVSSGVATKRVSSTALGSPSTGVWYCILFWHDSVADTLNIQVNNGVVDSVAWANGIQDGIGKFSLGLAVNCYGAGYGMNGRIGPTMFWKSTAGLGGVLTVAQRTALFAAGAGLPYAGFTI
jgi:hypothetical protein